MAENKAQLGYKAALVLAAYSLIVLGLDKAFGKEAAGAAGVGLTSLATVLLQKTQKRGHQHSNKQSSKAPLGKWGLVLLSCGFIGMQVSAFMLYRVLRLYVPSLPEVTTLSYGFALTVTLQGLSYAATGVLITSLPQVRIAEAAMSAWLAYFFLVVTDVVQALNTRNWIEFRWAVKSSAPIQVFCILYVALAIAPLFVRQFKD